MLPGSIAKNVYGVQHHLLFSESGEPSGLDCSVTLHPSLYPEQPQKSYGLPFFLPIRRCMGLPHPGHLTVSSFRGFVISFPDPAMSGVPSGLLGKAALHPSLYPEQPQKSYRLRAVRFWNGSC